MKSWKLNQILVVIVVGLALISPIVFMLLSDVSEPPKVSSDIQEELLGLQNQILGKFSQIIALVVTLIASLTVILGVSTYASLKEKLEQDIEEEFEKRIGVANVKTLLLSFNELAFQQYSRYENILQECLSNNYGESHPRTLECIRYVKICISLTEHALGPFEELSEDLKERFLSDSRGQKAFVNIINQYIYSRTAYFLLTSERPSEKFLEDLDEKTETMLNLGLGKTLAADSYNWWEAYETAGFYYISIGSLMNSPHRRRKGKNIIQELINKQRPKAYLRPLPDYHSETVSAEYKANGYDIVS